MIDKITIHITDKGAKVWRLNIDPDRQTGQDHFQGHIKNMLIRETLDGVTIHGSIAKYFQGENITPMTREKYKEALHSLELDTGLDFHNAIIRQAEIGASFIMNNQPLYYLQNMESVGRFKRVKTDSTAGLETVTFNTSTGARAFCGYNKIKEMTDKRQTIPPLYQGCNVLRLEYRIQRRAGIKKYLGGGQDITPYDLADPTLYRNFAGQFYEFYKQIPKTGRQVFICKDQDITPSKLNDLVAEHYRQASPEQYKTFMQALKEQGKISPKSLERVRATERANAKNYTFSDTNELIHELDEKVRLQAYTGA